MLKICGCLRVFVSVCVRERERDRERVWKIERLRVRVRVRERGENVSKRERGERAWVLSNMSAAKLWQISWKFSSHVIVLSCTFVFLWHCKKKNLSSNIGKQRFCRHLNSFSKPLISLQPTNTSPAVYGTILNKRNTWVLNRVSMDPKGSVERVQMVSKDHKS